MERTSDSLRNWEKEKEKSEVSEFRRRGEPGVAKMLQLGVLKGGAGADEKEKREKGATRKRELKAKLTSSSDSTKMAPPSSSGAILFLL